jgi:putative ABC transport system permease protein
MLGRSFLPEENIPGADQVVLLGHGFWQRGFGSRSDIIGQKINLDGQPLTVAGILPANLKLGYLLGFEPDYWKPFPMLNNPEQRADRSFLALAHLRSGISKEQAQADLALIARHLETQYPQFNKEWGILVSDLRGNVDPAVYLFILVAIGGILGVVCVNVTNLLLARAAAREKEIAIRMSLGSSRKRLIRQLLTESLLLALLGGSLGIALSFWALDLIKVLSAGTNLGILDIQLDLRVLGFTFLISLLTGMMVGLAPALQFTRVDLNQSLKEWGQSISVSSSRNRFKRCLVISEVALSMMLLVGGGLALKSLYGLLHVDRGFKAKNILVTGLPLQAQQLPNAVHRNAFFQQVLSRLETRSEIESAALTSAIPTSAPLNPFIVLGRPKPAPNEEPKARFTTVSTRYFDTLAIPLKTGRLFSEKDSSGSLPVAIVNETLARKQFGGQNALGTQIQVAGAIRSIVGVVGDTRNPPLDLVSQPEIYAPDLQVPSGHMYLVVRTRPGDPLDLSVAVKKEIHAVDPDQLVDDIRSMERALSTNMGVIKMGSSLLGVLAVGALILTAIGVYGVLSFLALQRTREFGIRMALGAHRQDVLRMVLRQGLTMVMIGIIPGLLASVALGRILASRIHGLSSFEPLLLLIAVLLFSAVSLVACYIPARRATMMDPLVALKYE